MSRAACDRVGLLAAHAAGFRGERQVVAVCDTGLDLGDLANPHPALAGTSIRHFSFRQGGERWDDPHGHGTHVIGCIFGQAGGGSDAGTAGTGPGDAAAAGDAHWTGSAPGAELYLQSVYGTRKAPFERRPVRIDALLRDAFRAGARIHSNSWDEASSRGVYSRTAEDIDAVVQDHPELLVVVAVGNSGTYASASGGPVPSTLRSPSPAKNALAVGATKNDRPEHSRPYRAFFDRKARRRIPAAILDEGWSLGPDGVAPFSGRGPTADGRIKPDLVAPGTAVISARSRHRSNIFPTLWGTLTDPEHAIMGGTSVAAPLVAGAAAVARQYLIDVLDVPSPSSALLRAVLLNGAAPLHGALVPNPNQGWGRLDVTASLALEPELSLRVFEDEVRAGGAFRLTLPLARSPRPLRVTLAWIDPPGDRLVSDLDLVVRTGGGEWHGNQAPGEDTFDRTNTVERVMVADATESVEIEIRAARLDSTEQPFALAVTGALE